MAEAAVPSVEDNLDKDIDFLLNRADLQCHRESFIHLGVVKVKHFLDVEDDNLVSDVGLTKIEIRRLKRNYSELQAEQQQTDSGHTRGIMVARAPKKRKQAILSWGNAKLMILRSEALPEKEPWDQYLVPNPHSQRLKFYNSLVKPIYESAFIYKQTGFKQYLMEQQQMRWQVNKKIQEISNKVNNLLKNEKWGVCQNIKKYLMAGADGCTYEDTKKCESTLASLNDTLNAASNLLSDFETKRKILYNDDHMLKLYATDELSYITSAIIQVQVVHKELEEATSKLTTTIIELQRKFPLLKRTAKNSRRKKENKRKVRKLKEKRLEERARILLAKLTSNAVAEESFEAIKNNEKPKTVNSFRSESTAKLTKRLHLDPLAWLLKRDIFNEKLTMALQVVLTSLNEPNDINDADSDSTADEEVLYNSIIINDDVDF